MSGTPYPVPPTQSPLGDPAAGVEVSTEEEGIEESSIGSAIADIGEERSTSAKDTSNPSSLETEYSDIEEPPIEGDIVRERKETTKGSQEVERPDQPGKGLRSRGPAEAIQLGLRDRQVAVTAVAWKSQAEDTEQPTLRGEHRDAEHEARRSEQDAYVYGESLTTEVESEDGNLSPLPQTVERSQRDSAALTEVSGAEYGGTSQETLYDSHDNFRSVGYRPVSLERGPSTTDERQVVRRSRVTRIPRTAEGEFITAARQLQFLVTPPRAEEEPTAQEPPGEAEGEFITAARQLHFIVTPPRAEEEPTAQEPPTEEQATRESETELLDEREPEEETLENTRVIVEEPTSDLEELTVQEEAQVGEEPLEEVRTQVVGTEEQKAEIKGEKQSEEGSGKEVIVSEDEEITFDARRTHKKKPRHDRM